MSSRWTRPLSLLFAMLFLSFGHALLPRLDRLRETHHLSVRATEIEGIPPEYILTSALLGGLRGAFITALWIQAQDMKQEGDFYAMVDIYNIITKLQPNHANAWAFQAWDLAFNISVEFKENRRDRVFWVFRAIELLRDQGIPRNPKIAELYHELSWIFYFKVGQDLDEGHGFYREYLAQQVDSIFHGPVSTPLLEKILEIRKQYPTEKAFWENPDHAATRDEFSSRGYSLLADAAKCMLQPHPSIQDLLSDPRHHRSILHAALWQMGERAKKELGLEIARMLELHQKFGEIDWRLPHAHSLYWAWLGNEVFYSQDPPSHNLKYERLIYFSLIMLVYRGECVSLPDGSLYGLPDYRLFERVLAYMDERIAYYEKTPGKDGKKANLIGWYSGYENFLRSAVFNAYFDGNKTAARALLKRVYTFTKNEASYGVDLETFIAKEIGEYVDGMSKDETFGLILSYCVRAFERLTANDLPGFRAQRAWGEYLHAYAQRRWPDRPEKAPDDFVYERTVPPFHEFMIQAALRILKGEYPQLFDAATILLFQQQLRGIDPNLWRAVKAAWESLRSEHEERWENPAKK